MNKAAAAGPDLRLCGSHARRVPASLTRIWENVLDWEHLPHLHAGTFAACRIEAQGPWGWRAALTSAASGREERVDLRIDRPAGRYATRLLDGPFAGGEIRVALTAVADHVTDVLVEFHLPLDPGPGAEAIGAAFARAYAVLWDEDEGMMVERQRILDGGPAAGSLTCPHMGGPLAPDPSDPGTLVCPWHGWRFDLASGRETSGRKACLPS